MLISAKRARAQVCGSALAIVAMLLAACGGDGGSPVAPGPPPPPPVPFAGVYALHSISDSLLPHRVPHPQFGPFYVESGDMKLNTDMSYSYSAGGITTGNVPVTATDTGTFSESGSNITFTSKFLHGIIYTATASDSSLAVALQGSLLGTFDDPIPLVFLKAP